MVSRIEVIFTDDTDGSKADETVKFALDGVQYAIDLSDKNATAFRAELGRYIRAGRKVSASDRKRGYGKAHPVGASRPPARERQSQDRELSRQVRQWANGHVAGSGGFKGRISGAVMTAYERQDPTLIPGYQAPTPVDVKSVSLNLTEGGVTAKKTQRVPAQTVQKPEPVKPTKAARASRRATPVVPVAGFSG